MLRRGATLYCGDLGTNAIKARQSATGVIDGKMPVDDGLVAVADVLKVRGGPGQFVGGGDTTAQRAGEDRQFNFSDVEPGGALQAQERYRTERLAYGC